MTEGPDTLLQMASPWGWSDLVWIVIGLIAYFLLHGTSMLLERSGPIRLRHWAEEAGGALRTLYSQGHRFEAFRLLLSGFGLIAVIGVAVLWTARAEGQGLNGGVVALGVGLLLALTLMVDLSIRRRILRGTEEDLRRTTPIFRSLYWLARPLVPVVAVLVRQSASIVHEDDDEASEGEIAAFLDVGAREGILEPGEEDLVHRVIDFGDETVESVMTPRIDIVGASIDSTLEELTEVALEGRHSRLPLYRDSLDEIVGILHIRDLLRGLRERPNPSALSLARTPTLVPETKQISQLMSELQVGRQHMAIVVDEYGGTAGLVTLEDLIEELIGEIRDEDEEVVLDRESLADGRWRVGGGMNLDDFDELFETAFEDSEFQTVGGLIFGTLGRIPVRDEELELEGLCFRVEEVVDRRVVSVLVDSLPEQLREVEA